MAAAIALVACGGALADEAAPAAANGDTAIHGIFNPGEDFTRPASRFDVREKYERLPASLEFSRQLMHDKGFEPYQWQLEGRIGYFY